MMICKQEQAKLMVKIEEFSIFIMILLSDVFKPNQLLDGIYTPCRKKSTDVVSV